MGKKTIIAFIALGSCAGFCLLGLLLSVLSPRFFPPPDASRSNERSQPTAIMSFGKRSIMVTVFTVKQDFAGWEAVGDYEQGQSPNGQVIAIFHNDPVTKASLVISRGILSGGQLIGQLVSVTSTDPAAIDWITLHLNGGGETTIGHTHILVDDDTEAGRVIIEFTFVP